MGVKKFQEFTDLLVWQKAHELTIKVYKIAKKFPKEERFRLVNQVCKSSSSIPANIAEGFGRASKKEFSQLKDRYNEISKMLSGLIRSIKENS